MVGQTKPKQPVYNVLGVDDGTTGTPDLRHVGNTRVVSVNAVTDDFEPTPTTPSFREQRGITRKRQEYERTHGMAIHVDATEYRRWANWTPPAPPKRTYKSNFLRDKTSQRRHLRHLAKKKQKRNR